MTVDPMGVLALQRALTQASDLLDAVTPDDLVDRPVRRLGRA